MPDAVKIIIGITEDGKKFRPSDWSKRLAVSAAVFGVSKRMQYHRYIHPCFIAEHNASGVCVYTRLEIEEPGMYEYIMNFAASNNLMIIEGRRSEQRETS